MIEIKRFIRVVTPTKQVGVTKQDTNLCIQFTPLVNAAFANGRFGFGPFIWFARFFIVGHYYFSP